MSACAVAKTAKLGLSALGIALASTAFGAPAAAPAGTGAKAAPAKADDASLAKGRELFNNWSCGSCHSLADAGATGHVGPSFDGDANLNKDFIINRVTNGQGAMPAFGGQLTDEEIAELATYITQVSAK
ncbi:MAG TPA: cytochrome c [Sphingomonadaceae bacterium]|nr:cytochrome c [Sphingomonadaceae bacterium]